ncbi:hypothetical protein GEMRC1_007099 [Eukaryota sp. GEM-RC1]
MGVADISLSTAPTPGVSLFEPLRELALERPDIHEAGKMAFVCGIRSYSEHKLGFIFRIRKFDVVGRAKCLGLLHLPKCPELKKRSKEDVKYDSIWIEKVVEEKVKGEKKAIKTRWAGCWKQERKLRVIWLRVNRIVRHLDLMSLSFFHSWILIW